MAEEKKLAENIRYTYSPRLTEPESGNPYYNRTPSGYSSAIKGNVPKGSDSSVRTGSLNPQLNVLRNCVGYANGRFNEIIGEGRIKYSFTCNAEKFIQTALGYGLQVGQTPQLGAIMCWRKGSASTPDDGVGHVAIVESIDSDTGNIVISQSGWSSDSLFWTETKYPGDGNWRSGTRWNMGSSYYFQGFIYNPAVPVDATVGNVYHYSSSGEGSGPSVSLEPIDIFSIFGGAQITKNNKEKATIEWTEETREQEVTRARTVDYDGVLNQTKATNLLTYPTNVESPFIILKVGKFTFGTYSAVNSNSVMKVTYPNFIRSAEVTKINGQLNQYTIQLVYQIQQGDDPNLVDKVFSSVGYGATVKISYGDWNAPTFIYKEEEAIITKLTSNVDFASAKITYTLNCTSTALGLVATSHNFEGGTFKPSEKILSILFDSRFGLTKVFTGMKSKSQVLSNGWIATNDKAVEVEPRQNIDPLSYINYLVSCMIGDTNGDDVLLDSSYYLTLVDDAYSEQGGPHFTIKQIYSNTKTIHNQDVYEVDIGYPSDAMVMNFSIRDDNSWSLLYKYNGDLQDQNYVYNIDNDGRVINTYSPAYSTSAAQFNTTPSQKNWWTQVTQFPISATLEIKGLVRPAMLMSYVKVNAFFYGHRHIASGIYFVTKQVDKVDGRGYRTTLSLTRFGGDEDYIKKETEQYTVKVGKIVTSD